MKITDEPGSAPDRVVINIDVVEQPTGDFSVMGGYSTAEGWLAEVSVQERNLLGTGRFAKASATYGEYIRSVELGYAEPYFLDTRSSMGIDLFAKQTLAQLLSVVWNGVARRHAQMGSAAARRPLVPTALFRLYAEDYAAVLFERLQ